MTDNYSDITPKDFVTNAADTSAPKPLPTQRENAAAFEAALQHLDNEIFRLHIKREREVAALRERNEILAKQNFEEIKQSFAE
jgi:signal-transduction protein with cAMP-binding, CBS, and nucleotidyltransferase domain